MKLINGNYKETSCCKLEIQYTIIKLIMSFHHLGYAITNNIILQTKIRCQANKEKRTSGYLNDIIRNKKHLQRPKERTFSITWPILTYAAETRPDTPNYGKNFDENTEKNSER